MSVAEMQVTLPLPPATLSPNARVVWQVKARVTKQYRALAHGACYQQGYRWSAATAQATFYHRDKRRRDRDNLLASLKSAFDGIAAAGVVVDDANITHLPVRCEVDRENPRVEIRIVRA